MMGKIFFGIIRNCKSMETTKIIALYISNVLINFCTSEFSEIRFNFLILGINLNHEFKGKVFKRCLEFNLS